MVGDVFGYNKEVIRKRHYWLLGIKVKNAAKHSIIHRIAPLNKQRVFVPQMPIAPRLRCSGLK